MAANKNQILEIINTVLKNSDRPTVENINEETRLREDIGFDSLALAELTVRIEAEFGVDIFEDGFVSTIGEILKKLEKDG